jgi:hypothetical protein
MHYDIFNGDADGIFSLHQYRLHNPLSQAQLITGVKRDICLLSQVENVRNCSLSVFDISLDSNRSSLLQLLQNNNKVIYFDHHFAGELIDCQGLQLHINPSPTTCTSLIVNNVLRERHGLWAVCGAFGDNLLEPAIKLAKSFHLSKRQTDLLREFGELYNYNSYGSSLSDLLFHPCDLYEGVQPFADPFEYLKNSQQVCALQAAYHSDLALAMQQKELQTPGRNRIYYLPDAPWARRVVGVFSNLRAREQTASAHTIITENHDGTLRISVRAPLEAQHHADTLCKLYSTGGGRAAAAGINSLPKDMLERFLSTFNAFYSRQ